MLVCSKRITVQYSCDVFFILIKTLDSFYIIAHIAGDAYLFIYRYNQMSAADL